MEKQLTGQEIVTPPITEKSNPIPDLPPTTLLENEEAEGMRLPEKKFMDDLLRSQYELVMSSDYMSEENKTLYQKVINTLFNTPYVEYASSSSSYLMARKVRLIATGSWGNLTNQLESLGFKMKFVEADKAKENWLQPITVVNPEDSDENKGSVVISNLCTLIEK